MKTETVEIAIRGYSLSVESLTFNLYNYGDFPQTIAANQNDSYYTVQPIYNNWYLGSDGYFYEKCLENAWSTGYKYSNGENSHNLSANSFKYFKVEPISWRALEENGYDMLLFSNYILIGNISYFPYASRMRITRYKTINPNNFGYSRIFAYLNAAEFYYDVNSYGSFLSSSEYENNGFRTIAFTPSALSYFEGGGGLDNVQSTLPDYFDELPSPAKSRLWNDGQNEYAFEQGIHGISLLSVREITNIYYGFADTDSGYDSSNNYNGIYSRAKLPTDYAIATGVELYTSAEPIGAYYLRSPHYSANNKVYYVDFTGRIQPLGGGVLCDTNRIGIVPTMKVFKNPHPIQP